MAKKFASVIVILAGAALIAAGIGIAVPGDHLTTWSLLDGTDGFSSIREYVGGDAYNYIIGASLVAGHISGSLTMKAVFIAAGVTTACIGLLLLASPFTKKDVSEPSGRHASDEAPKRPQISESTGVPTSDDVRSGDTIQSGDGSQNSDGARDGDNAPQG